jgi:cytochrome c biogenesis protein ResB
VLEDTQVGVEAQPGEGEGLGPGLGHVWIAAALIMGGLMLTLRRPRARLWLQIRPGVATVPIALLTERGTDSAQYGAIIRRITHRLSGEGA